MNRKISKERDEMEEILGREQNKHRYRPKKVWAIFKEFLNSNT